MFRSRAAARAASAQEHAAEVAESPCVLVADDDRMVRELLTAGLRRDGYRVLAVADGNAALDAARSADLAAAVLDWLMPGVQGPEVCRLIKADPRTAAMPVLLLTSRSRDDEVQQAFECGADDYVTKPFHLADVMRLVNRLVRDGGQRPSAARAGSRPRVTPNT